MATYAGYLIDPFQFAGNTRTQAITPWKGWDREWSQSWGDVIRVFDSWDVNWGFNWGDLGSGTRFSSVFAHIDIAKAGGTVTKHGHLQFPANSHAGVLIPSFGGVFYNRILIEPTIVDFGSIVSDQQMDVEVFNAYLTNVTLSNMIESDFDSGLSVSGDPTPDIYYPLEEKTYTVEATLAGPPETDATLTFDWLAPIDDITISIVGTRIVLFPIAYRGDQVKETILFKTDVLNSHNGTEQRVQIRQNPRHRFSVKGYLNRDARFRVENLIYGWRARIWAIPMWPDARQADPITVDDTIIYLDTTYADFRVDGLAVIWEHATKFDVFQIAGKTDTSLSLNRGVNDTYDSPTVMPVRSARMVQNPTRKTSGFDAVVETILEVIDNLAYPADPSTIQFNGEDTFFMEPLATDTDGVKDSYEHRIDLVDSTSGALEQFSPWNFIRINREFELILEGSQDIWETREWLYRRAGKLRPFYMPTYENNLRLLTVGSILDSFEIRDDAHSTQAAVRNHIAVLLTDGSYLLRTILSSEVNLDGNIDITIDTPLNVQSYEIDEISYFGLKRLSSDEIDITWMPNNVASVVVPTTELEP